MLTTGPERELRPLRVRVRRIIPDFKREGQRAQRDGPEAHHGQLAGKLMERCSLGLVFP